MKNFKKLIIYLSFCICLIGYNSETKSQSSNSQTAETYLNSGREKERIGRDEEAVADYTEALKLNPRSFDILSHRAFVNADLGRYSEVIADWSAAIEIKPRNAVAYLYRGMAKAALGRYEEAIADLSAAIEIEPQNALLYHTRGMIKAKSDRHVEMVADLHRALEIDPNIDDAHRIRQMAKEQQLPLRGNFCVQTLVYGFYSL